VIMLRRRGHCVNRHVAARGAMALRAVVGSVPTVATAACRGWRLWELHCSRPNIRKQGRGSEPAPSATARAGASSRVRLLAHLLAEIHD
jgi:hypothetical protein